MQMDEIKKWSNLNNMCASLVLFIFKVLGVPKLSEPNHKESSLGFQLYLLKLFNYFVIVLNI